MAFRRRLIPFRHNFVLRLLKKIGLFSKESYQIEPDILNGQIQAELGISCLKRYKSVLKLRNENTVFLMERSKLRTWLVAVVVKPAWLRQKVACKSSKDAHNLSIDFQRLGIRIGNFNWSKLINSKGQKGFYLSQHLSDCWVDVPIHQNLSSEQISFIAAKLLEE